MRGLQNFNLKILHGQIDLAPDLLNEQIGMFRLAIARACLDVIDA